MEGCKVLIVDDEKEIRDAIEIYLRGEGIEVLKAKDGIEALKILEEKEVHLIILDIMMPRLDGIRTCMRIREKKNIPIVMLSAKGEDRDKILGLNIGADDYITKPFNHLEMVARVKSQLRRYVAFNSHSASDKVIAIRGLEIHKESKNVILDGEEIKLTPTEYKILILFAEN